MTRRFKLFSIEPLHKHKRLIAMSYDVCVVPVAWILAYWLRFNLDYIPQDAFKMGLKLLPSVSIFQMAAYWTVGLYRGVWRFSSLPDLVRIFRAVVMGCGLSFLWIYYLSGLVGFPRAVLPLYGVLLVLFLGGARFSIRWLKEYRAQVSSAMKRVLIVGAGHAGEGLVRDLLRTSEQYKPIAFVDDRLEQQGREIHGIRVLGTISDIPALCQKHAIDLIMIATPSATSVQMRRMMRFCKQTTCAIRTLPSLKDMVLGRIHIDLLREVSLEDLLGRDPVHIDWAAIRTAIHHKRVLVTGGGGSIGSELCRQIARLEPAALIVIDRSEYNLFSLEQELSTSFPKVYLERYLIDINDTVALAQCFAQHQPELVFHAAAFKHVPLLENQLREAVLNNILGTYTLAKAALDHGVSKFVLVSTDKAVNPSNVMGASKRVAELICHAFNQPAHTQFMMVRFGNVLGSAGSVVPIFKEQLAKGGPLTVTHPEMTRFFMTIPEASQLILQALSLGQGGEIFVLDMGEPVKIQFLAEQLIQLAGKKVNEDIQIQYTGIRPGEKLYEELFYEAEALVPTEHPKIFRAQNEQPLLEAFEQNMQAFKAACQLSDSQGASRLLYGLLQQWVPTFKGVSA